MPASSPAHLARLQVRLVGGHRMRRSESTPKFLGRLSEPTNHKFQSDVRDYGNANNSFKDVILPSFQVFNFTNSFNLNDSTKIYLNLMNIFDEKYAQAYQYSTYGRNLNIVLKQSF